MALSADQALPLISQYESGNANVLTKIQPATGPRNTASGYYQITNGTWQDYAKQAGVDPVQYPTAMSDPSQADQAKVATAIYNARGLQPWNTNAPLMAATSAADTGGSSVTTDPYAAQTDAMGNPLPTMSTSTATPMADPLTSQGATVANAIPNAASSMLSWQWGLIQRGGLMMAGFALVFIAVAAMLWQSKTVQTGASNLKAMA